MTPIAPHHRPWRTRGLTLVECVMASLIVGVALVAAVRAVSASRMGERRLADAKAAQTLAHDLLNEITAQRYAGPSDTASVFGRTADENATGNRSRFDDVNDYINWTEAPPKAKDGTALASYDNTWRREVALSMVSPTDPNASSATDQGLAKITVTVKRNNVTLASVSTLRSAGLAATEACKLPSGTWCNLVPAHNLALGGTSSGPGTNIWTLPESGTVAHWKLDETSGTAAADSAGSNHGTLVNGPTRVTGKCGKALRFDGYNDYVSISNSACFQVTRALTIAAWVKGETWPNNTSWANVVLRKGDANPNNWQLAIWQGKVALYLDANDDVGVTGTTTLATNTWYHVAGTWDGSTVRIYVNGVLNNTPVSRTAAISTDTRPVYLGGRSGSTDILKGTLDDVRFYNKALSAAEITTLYNGGDP